MIGLLKAEMIHRRGPWRSFEAVEFATLERVDWFNRRRLLELIGNVPPAEAEIRGRSAEERRAVRQERSRLVIEALEAWLREKLGLLSRKSNLAEEIRYALSRWAGLSLFLDDGHVEIDSNTVERAIRPLALNR